MKKWREVRVTDDGSCAVIGGLRSFRDLTPAENVALRAETDQAFAAAAERAARGLRGGSPARRRALATKRGAIPQDSTTVESLPAADDTTGRLRRIGLGGAR